MDKETLLKLLQDDDEGLLTIKPQTSALITADERLVASFQEINQFIRDNGREPTANRSNVKEMMLHSRLISLQEDARKAEALKPFDEFGLLAATQPVGTFQDILEDEDGLDILDDPAESIFVLKHIPAKETTMPDYIARRKPCQDFDQFEPLFKQCQADLAANKRKIMPFAMEQQIYKGGFFVLKGILLYIADEGERELSGGKVNARLRCVFENGTESDMLLRSLAAELYKNGRRVSSHNDHLLDNLKGLTNEDQETGYLYILKSLSDKPEIKSLSSLYKIGFSRIAVEERIKNAHQEATFLMAPVSVISAYQCYNLNPQKLELLLHNFFGKACLDLDVFDSKGKRHIPREWFVAPLPVIEQAIKLLLNGEIVHYLYNPDIQEIVERFSNDTAS